MTFSILVCVKAVVDASTVEPPAPGDRWIDTADCEFGMNLYDAHALEVALAMRDADETVRITALSVGGDVVRDTIRRAMAMGADAGVQLAVDGDAPLPAERVAAAVADYARPKKFDLILTGAMSEDAMQGTTGPMIAAALDRPCAVAAVDIRRTPQAGGIEALCEMEAGMAEVVHLSGPSLVTVQTGRRTPRYPSLSNTLRARRQPIEQPETPKRQVVHAARSVGVAFPAQAGTCRIIEGSPVDKADALLTLFNDNGWLK